MKEFQLESIDAEIAKQKLDFDVFMKNTDDMTNYHKCNRMKEEIILLAVCTFYTNYLIAHLITS